MGSSTFSTAGVGIHWICTAWLFYKWIIGCQFIREKEFDKTILILEQTRKQINWLPALDPAQLWGKSLPHGKDRAFQNIPGTVVAMCAGVPVAVFERQGKVLRVFDNTSLSELLHVFSREYVKRRLFPMISRLQVKQYPKEAVDALISAGFVRELQDYVLYRG